MAPRPARILTLVAIVAVALAAVAPAAAAQQDPSTTPAPTTTQPPATQPPATQAPATDAPTTETAPAHPEAQALAELAAQITKNQGLLEQLNGQVQESTAKLAALKAQVDDTAQKLETTRNEIARLKSLMKARAAYMYQHSNTPEAASFDIQHVVDITAGKKYAESATHTDGLKVDDLAKLDAELEARKQQLDEQEAAQQQEHDRLVNAQQAIEALTTKQKKLLDEAGAIPVMGDARAHRRPGDRVVRLDAREVPARRRAADRRPGEDLLRGRRGREGAPRAGLRAGDHRDRLVRQGPRQQLLRPRRVRQLQRRARLPHPRDGVRAQIQLLKAYADPTARGETLANPPSPVLWGADPIAAATRFDTEYLKGKVPLWNMMGNGNWATDPGYALKVLTVYFQMLAFAANH